MKDIGIVGAKARNKMESDLVCNCILGCGDLRYVGCVLLVSTCQKELLDVVG